MANEEKQTGGDARFQEALFESLFVQERSERTVTPAEIEVRGGMTVRDLADMYRTFGLPAPAPDDPYFTPAEAEALTQLGMLGELWPQEVRLNVSRIYGHALSQMATTEVEVFRSHVEQSVRSATPDEASAIAELAHAYGRLAPLVGPIMLGVHQRWLEHVMAQAAVGAVDRDEGVGRFADTVEVALLFCDLIDFTHFTSRHGDLAAARAAAEFAGAVHQHKGPEGYLVKELGDGALVAYPNPKTAVRAWEDIVAAAQEQSLPPLHGGLHYGHAVFRDGDYFGNSVNLAARLANRARRGELWATRPVVNATSDLIWRPRGRKRLAGIQRSVAVFSLAEERSEAVASSPISSPKPPRRSRSSPQSSR